jgi:hypothetical protein
MDTNEQNAPELKLFMVLLGCKPPGRHIEQHDIFFGVARSLRDLVPEIKAYWQEPERIHLDAWREVTNVDAFNVKVVPHNSRINENKNKLFFINLGGYQENRFEEQHYILLAVRQDKAEAFREAKETLFYQHNRFSGAGSHIDDKYGIDVDDLYEIEELLSQEQKAKYKIEITPSDNLQEDQIHLGYFKLDSL